jgi:hypothetical protein
VVKERGRSGGESSSMSGRVTLNRLSENNMTDPRPVQNGHCATMLLKLEIEIRLTGSGCMATSRATPPLDCETCSSSPGFALWQFAQVLSRGAEQGMTQGARAYSPAFPFNLRRAAAMCCPSRWCARTGLVRDGAVSSGHKDLLLLPASPRCTLCTTRRRRLDAGTCRADGREL